MNFDISYSDPHCQHHDACGCIVTLVGKGPSVIGLEWKGTAPTISGQYLEMAAKINTYVPTVKVDGSPKTMDSEIEYFKAMLPNNSTMTILPTPPGTRPHWPTSAVLCSVHPAVEEALKRADFRYFRHRFKSMSITWQFLEEQVWVRTIGPNHTLQGMALRQLSSWHQAVGHTNGRPHVLAAMANLYPGKLARAVLSAARPRIGDRPLKPLEHLNDALDHMYRLMACDLRIKEQCIFSLKPLEGMYLGASNGPSKGESKTIPKSEDVPFDVKVSPKGKKIDTFEQDLVAIMDFLRTGKAPSISWSFPPKSENNFHFLKQWYDDQWAAAGDKCRVFNIPTGIYILLERLSTSLSHVKERGPGIRVGHRWSHGGADSIAKCLNIWLENCFDELIVEGDGRHYDQTVREFFTNLYFSFRTLHYDTKSLDLPIFKMINEFLIKHMSNRVTQVIGDVFAAISGGVPSGAFNTSHMDSWIMKLYFCLFACYTIANAPIELREELEAAFIMIVRIIVYGDDHLYNKGIKVSAEYFSGQRFAEFMKKHFDVEIRDVKDGIPFCSIVKDGQIVKMGATFLKHQFVLNTNVEVGQSKFLPFRESREYIVRAIHGRETKSRDQIDVLLSIIGHAYGTYASNRDAYDRLYLIYSEVLISLGDKLHDVPKMMLDRMTYDDLKKLRQAGLTAEELIAGFPSWETLQKKNIFDGQYQDISGVPFDHDSEIAGMGDFY